MESINIRRPEIGLHISSAQDENIIILQFSVSVNYSRIIKLINDESEKLDIWIDEPLNRILIFHDMTNKKDAIPFIIDAIDKYLQEISLL